MPGFAATDVGEFTTEGRDPSGTAFNAQITAWEEGVEAQEAASCTDRGLAPVVVKVSDYRGVCVGFPNGIGGRDWSCTGGVNGWYGYEGFL